jgi:FG-GAP-like repeat
VRWPWAPVYLAAGDFNHDGFEDFAVANSYAATSMSVILNNGDGTYAPPHLYPIAETGYEIEVADFNNDGNLDFAVRGATQYQIEYGKGDGTFFQSQNFATPAGQFEKGSQHGDFNGDGAIDLAYVSSAGVTVVMNANNSVSNLAGAVGFKVTAPASTTSGSALPMTVTAVDAAGNPATGFLGTVFVTSNDPAATSTFAYTFTAADAGTHSFSGSVRLVTLGDRTVTVASPLMTSSTSTVTVTPTVSKLAIGAPTATTAGDTFNVTVTAIDQLGGVGTGYSSTIHFSSSDVQAGLPADYTFTRADAGVHTFSVTFNSAGSKFLSATEVGGTITGRAFVTVSPAAASSFMLAGSGGSIGVARPITIVARDIYGNFAAGYTGTVHFTSSDPSAVLPADTALVNGSATVNVTFMTVGTQTITATDVATPTLTGTMSSDATSPVAKLFSVTGFPATTAGVAQTFTVTVRDTIGQVATGYTGTIYFSTSDVQAGLPFGYTFTAADASVHTFTGTLRTAGTQSISARDSTGALFGSEVGISVTPAAFAGYRLSVPIPTDSHGHYLMTAGDLISLTVRATDVFGNAVVGYNGTAKFSSTDAQAGLPTDYTFTAADAGVHTFTVALKTSTPNGVVWSFSVVDSANAATLVTLTNFEVVNAAASTFAVSVPTQITAGSPFTSKVTVNDAYGNGVKNYFGTVHFSTTAGLAGLPGDYTFNSSDAGVHDFTLTLNTSGNQTLSVVDVNNPLLNASANAGVNSSAASTFVAAFPANTTAGAAQAFSVTVLDAFGNVAASYRGTVSFSSSDVQAGLPLKYTFTNTDSGVHTFNVTLKTAGSQSIAVKDPVNAAFSATQSGISVAASATAGSFVVMGFPATTAGMAQAFTVTVKDAFGNITTGYTGTVTFSGSDIYAGLPANYTFTAADASAHTFTATLKTAGRQSITVKDAVASTVVGSQTGITVTAATTVASLSVSGFPATTAGAARTFTVTARDAFGNLCSGYTGTVTFSSSDVQAGLPPRYTFTAADAGAHTFTATLKKAGTQSIGVTDTASSTLMGSQTGIAVSAGAAARFSISAPNSVTQGVGFKFTMTVLDAYGNVVTGYRGKVHLASTDSKGGTSDYTFSSSDNGVHVFSYTFNTLGFQTLTLTDTTSSSIFGSAIVNVLTK